MIKLALLLFLAADPITTAKTPVKVNDSTGNGVTSTVSGPKRGLDVNIVGGAGSGGTSSNFGAAFPAAGTAVGAKDSTGLLMSSLNLDAAGLLKVNVAAGGAGGGLSQLQIRSGAGAWTDVGYAGGNLQMPVAQATRANLLGNMTLQLAGVDVSLANAVPVQPGTGAVFPASQSGTWNINNVSGTVSLPTGAATESTLSTVNGKIPLNLTVTATRLLTDGSGVTQPVSGTVTANAGTGTMTVGQATGSNLHVVVDSGAITATVTSTTANQGTPAIVSNAWPTKLVDSAGVNVATVSAAGAVKVDGSATTQPVSGTVTANAGTGNFTVTQGTGTNLHTVVDSGTISTITNPVTVTDGAGALNVIVDSGTLAATQSGTWNINNVSGTVSLPTGAATETTLGTRLADATFTGRINTLGQKTMANSTPVVLASDQSAIPASQSGTWSTRMQDGSGTLLASAAAPVNGTTVGLVTRGVMKTATNPLVTAFSCTTTAAPLPATALTNRQSLCVFNNGAARIYLGDSAVTTTSGFPIPSNGSWCDDVGSQVVYCVTSGAAKDVRVWEN